MNIRITDEMLDAYGRAYDRKVLEESSIRRKEGLEAVARIIERDNVITPRLAKPGQVEPVPITHDVVAVIGHLLDRLGVSSVLIPNEKLELDTNPARVLTVWADFAQDGWVVEVFTP